MIRLAQVFMLLAVSSIACAASAQDFTTQDPRYTTTPPEYTTTPEEYTTTPSQYTTTPPEYIPQADTVPPTGGPTTPTIPTIPGTGNGNNPLPNTPTAVTGTNTGTTVASQSVTSQAFVEEETTVEETETVEPLEADSATETDSLIESFAGCVLRLDEEETQQFVDDYNETLAELGLKESEVGWSTRFQVVLYLTLRHLLGLSDTTDDTPVVE